MKQANKDMYYDDIEIKPNHIEAVKEIERINLDKEKKDAKGKNR